MTIKILYFIYENIRVKSLLFCWSLQTSDGIPTCRYSPSFRRELEVLDGP